MTPNFILLMPDERIVVFEIGVGGVTKYLKYHRVSMDSMINCSIGLNFTQNLRFRNLGVVKIPPDLEVEPERRTIPEESGQSSRCCGGNPPPLINNLVHALIGHKNSAGKFLLGKAHGFKKLL